MSPRAAQSASKVRVAAPRRCAFSLAKAFSMGFSVDREVIRDHDIAALKGWGELGLDIGVERRAIHGAVHHPGRGEPIASEPGDKGLGAPAPGRSPRRLRPRDRVIFALTAVSSMNTKRAG